ncbi:unnamed protein product [Amoebophrya sp. A25]|nr:unnamed protein product [Amoebophrya sp. A25]|eukprot:GSA25T00013023001.1
MRKLCWDFGDFLLRWNHLRPLTNFRKVVDLRGQRVWKILHSVEDSKRLHLTSSDNAEQEVQTAVEEMEKRLWRQAQAQGAHRHSSTASERKKSRRQKRAEWLASLEGKEKAGDTVDGKQQARTTIFASEDDESPATSSSSKEASFSSSTTRGSPVKPSSEDPETPRDSSDSTAITPSTSTPIVQHHSTTIETVLVNSPPDVGSLARRFGIVFESDSCDLNLEASNWNYRPLHREQVRWTARRVHKLIHLEKSLREKNCFACKEWSHIEK